MIIVDTNVIMAFLITKGITEKIITQHRDTFITPDHCFNEIWKHRNRWNNRNYSDTELRNVMGKVSRLFIYPVSKDVYSQFEKEASKLIDDIYDIPIVALALAVENDGIWTYDTKHFKKEKLSPKIRLLSTREVLELHPTKSK